MSEKNIKGKWGELIIRRNNYVGDGIRKVDEFLELITTTLAIRIYKYILADNYEHPYIHGERSMFSHFAYAVAKYCDLHASELHVRRGREKKNSKGKYGRVDMWCHYKGIDFIFELKLSRCSLHEGKINSGFSSNWTSAIEQLREIKKHELEWSDYPCRIAFMPTLLISTGRNIKKEKTRRELISFRNDIIQESPIKKPNWTALLLANKSQSKLGYSDYNNQSYIPAILFSAFIFQNHLNKQIN